MTVPVTQPADRQGFVDDPHAGHGGDVTGLDALAAGLGPAEDLTEAGGLDLGDTAHLVRGAGPGWDQLPEAPQGPHRRSAGTRLGPSDVAIEPRL